MAGHDIIVVGASAGGVEALTTLIRSLPADLPAALFVVLHIPPQATSLLPQILERAGDLPVRFAQAGTPIESGHIYVAPPDRHLLVDRGYMRVIRGPKENRQRPAIDPLFRAAARVYGARVVGAVLTGTLDDGTAGLAAIKRRGGLSVVQDPDDALYPSMPRSALEHVEIDYCLPLIEIGPLLARLAKDPVAEDAPLPPDIEIEPNIVKMDTEALEGDQKRLTVTHDGRIL